MRSHLQRFKNLVVLIVLIGLVFNGVVFYHAYRMTHYSSAGKRTDRPEDLSRLRKTMVLVSGVTLPKPRNIQSPQDFNLPFQSFELDSTDGVQLHGWRIETREPKDIMIFFHGYAAAKDTMLGVAQYWYAKGWTCLVLDFRGSGDSQGRVTTLGVREALDVAAIWGWARDHYPKARLVGYGDSMGGVAMMNAIHEGFIKPHAVIAEKPFARMLDTIRNRFRAMQVPGFPSANLLTFWGGVQLGYNGFRHNPVEYATAIECPTLLLHGENDPRVTVEAVRSIKHAIGTNATLHVFQGAKHESLLDYDLAQYETVTSNWFARNVNAQTD